jgi:hypothetical protein
MANLLETVAGHAPGHVVGFYRSHMRNGLGMTEEDLLLFHRYFPEPSSVVLLVKPSASRPPIAGFFLREGDRVRAESSYLEFPFAAAESGMIPRDVAETAEPVAYPEIEPPAQVETPPRQSVWKLWQLGTLAGLVFGIGLLAGLWLAPKPAPGPATNLYSLGLSATPAGDSSVHIAWNRNAAAIRAASGGMLYIRDGQSARAVEMDRTQLQTGSITYRRQNAQVQFRLEVFAGDRIIISELVEYPDQ